MTSRARLLATVLLLAPVTCACGKGEAVPPALSATTGTPLQLAGTALVAAPATARPSATAAPKVPVTTIQAMQPTAPPAPVAATPAAPPTPPAEKPAATQPATPAHPAAQRPKGKVTLPAKLGAVIFDHERHVAQLGVACTTCHHPSRPPKPLASENQACRDCHTMPATPPMKTSLQAAFHDPKGATGTCIGCHKEKGGSAPVKCLQCHKKK